MHASDSLSLAVRVQRELFRPRVVDEMMVSRNAVLSGSLVRVVSPLEARTSTVLVLNLGIRKLTRHHHSITHSLYLNCSLIDRIRIAASLWRKPQSRQR